MSRTKLLGIIAVSIAVGANVILLFQHLLHYGAKPPIFPATGALIILIVVLFNLVRKSSKASD